MFPTLSPKGILSSSHFTVFNYQDLIFFVTGDMLRLGMSVPLAALKLFQLHHRLVFPGAEGDEGLL